MGLEQDPDCAPAVSTANGQVEAMNVVHALAESKDHDVAGALKDVDDANASGEALGHMLIGRTHSVEATSMRWRRPKGVTHYPPTR